MRAVVMRCSRAAVRVDGRTVGEIGPGFLVLLGVAADDGPADVDYLAAKVAGLRVFPDEEGRFNRSLEEV
ncbi:MAG: D-aminoacyl-tRNA deacylase, partial [Firmicutes bacterium]|nr:D-aminoacyl-tRNA deacylase [Bacillota bacterium]